jgi:hypothetical protein
MKIVDIVEGAVADLEKDLQHPHSYDAIDHMMQTIAQKHNITPDKLHDTFVKRHGITPDDWIKQRLDELTFMGSQCTKDCSGHRAGYAWSVARGRKSAASWSNSFNKGAEIAATGR